MARKDSSKIFKDKQAVHHYYRWPFKLRKKRKRSQISVEFRAEDKASPVLAELAAALQQLAVHTQQRR